MESCFGDCKRKRLNSKGKSLILGGAFGWRVEIRGAVASKADSYYAVN